MLNSPCRCSPSVEERLDPLIINFFFVCEGFLRDAVALAPVVSLNCAFPTRPLPPVTLSQPT